MNITQSPKLAFCLIALLWAFLWVGLALTAGGVFGDSLLQLSFFLGVAFVPPALAYGLLFKLLPWMWNKVRGTRT